MIMFGMLIHCKLIPDCASAQSLVGKCVQGCVEIIYISVQITMYTLIVYWMCWFQRDAGQSPLAMSLTTKLVNGLCASQFDMLHEQHQQEQSQCVCV